MIFRRRKKPELPPPWPKRKIVGFGGHAADIGQIALRCHITPVYIDDSIPEPRAIIGINDPQVRWAVNQRWSQPGMARLAYYTVGRYNALIDPSAIVGWDSEHGEGCVIGPLALVQDSSLGLHVHVGYGAKMTRTRIGAFTTIAPGVTICGDVKIGARCMIGAGAVIKNLTNVGDDCVIGAGAVVINDVPDGTTVVGVPARPIEEPRVRVEKQVL